ncbi:hypothetical protein IAT38_007985 [Cryptococcus sp. DSM 104549]
MAKSRFEYVRNYELPDPLMPNTFIIVRIDGKGFHKFSDAHTFEKPNDRRALDLMDTAAKTVFQEYKDVVMAFGESDEYSFLLRRATTLYNRRRSKINSSIVSLFTSAYVFNWPRFFPDKPLLYPPTFDGRVVLYPGVQELRDYFGWRQADTHINNLYNTAFWALVHGGQTTAEANKTLQGTDSKDKNELLFSQYGINYNTLPAMYRKGSILVREQGKASGPGTRPSEATPPDALPPPSSDSTPAPAPSTSQPPAPIASNVESVAPGTVDASSTEAASLQPGVPKPNKKAKKQKPYLGTEGPVVVVHEDIIRDGFWEERPWLLL